MSDQNEEILNQQTERAEDILGGLISLRSAWMGDEHVKAIPDDGALSRLLDEQSKFLQLRKNLYVMNLEEVNQIITTYSAQLKDEQLERATFLKSRNT
ncbi:hypothetical protein [Undibacterium sp. TC9W]|uniref:hypothetical protein n=1 Tax=Undibacterium sp. TC9W TaxID=3413053 RepID=UPI003BEF7188